MENKQSNGVFAYFIKNINKNVSKERILEDLWPNMNPVQTSTWLHTYIYQIRSVLKKYGLDQGLNYKNKGYCLDSKGKSSDVKQFEKLLTHAMVERIDYPSEYLKKAIQFYRGEFLQGFYNTWIVEEKNRLERLYLTILERLSKIHIEAKEYPDAMVYLRMLLKLDPLSEYAHEMLMRIYEKTGDRTSVINHFKAYYKTLNDELGIEPKKEIKALYNRCKT